MRTKQQVVAEFRSSEILAAARKVFSVNGFRDTTVDEVAAAAGLSKATVLYLLPVETGHLFGRSQRGRREMVDQIEIAMQMAPGGIRCKVQAYIRTRLEFLHENRDFFAVYHAEFGNLIHPAWLNQEFPVPISAPIRPFEAPSGRGCRAR